MNTVLSTDVTPIIRLEAGAEVHLHTMIQKSRLTPILREFITVFNSTYDLFFKVQDYEGGDNTNYKFISRGNGTILIF
jgi:hypothetical protein